MKYSLQLLTSCVIMLFGFAAYGQMERPYLPPSPDATALARRANIQVGYYTGIPNIAVPLGNVPGRDISVPISVDYHAGGIKVQDVASSVGLGWSLSAGGAITRIVRGLPDGTMRSCVAGSGDLYNNAVLGDCDGERDIFFFSFLGRTGKMFLDANGIPQTMPYHDLKISPGVGSASIGTWVITDELGYTYYFGETPASREQTTYAMGDHQDPTTYVSKSTFISTWYLSRIVSPKGKEVATFTYEAWSSVSYEMYGQKGIGCGSGATVIANDVKITIDPALYIKTISTQSASALFTYGGRQDLIGGRVLHSVAFIDDAGIVKKRFNLNTDYFGCSGEANCRLRLSSITEGIFSTLPLKAFIYNEHLTTTNPPVEMNPPRSDYHTDYFGYFTGTNTSMLSHALQNLPSGCDGTSKEPDLLATATKVFSLKEMTDALGSTTKFEYASNSGVGLRIASISTFENTTLKSKVTYSYSGGQGYRAPVLYYRGTDDKPIRSSTAYNAIFDLNGVAIGYTTVTETFLDGSKVVRQFKNFSDYPDTAPVVEKYVGSAMSPSLQGSADVNGPPFTPYISRAWMRGLPWTKEVKDASNNTLYREEMEYTEGAEISSISNYAVEVYSRVINNNPTYEFRYGTHIYRSHPVYLTKQTTRVYDQSNLSKFQERITSYAYHSIHKTFPTSVTTQVAGGPEQKVTFRYPIDLTGSIPSAPASTDRLAGGVWALVEGHVITAIEKLDYLKDYGASAFSIVGGELYHYRRNTISYKPLLEAVYQLALDNPIANLSPQASLINGGTVYDYDEVRYQRLQQYVHSDLTFFDAEDVILVSAEGTDGVKQNYEWGHNKSLVTATYTTLDTMRFKTRYSYNTINGMVSTTDLNNRNTMYFYDVLGRLKMVKDHETNILQRYSYNIKNTSSGPLDIARPSSLHVGRTNVPFQCATPPWTSGITRYVWDFGDGVVSESTASSTVHTYSSGGSYTIKLAIINPEYGTIYVTKNITIVNI